MMEVKQPNLGLSNPHSAGKAGPRVVAKVRGKPLPLIYLGVLASFLSFLFMASAGPRSDGRNIPSSSGILGNPSCFVSNCHATSGSTLNQEGSVAFMNVPAVFVPGQTYNMGISIIAGTVYGFQLAVVFSDDTQAGTMTSVTAQTAVDINQGVQVLTHTNPLITGTIDFQWTAPIDPKEGSVILKVASNSANGNLSPTGDAINELQMAIPQQMEFELTEKLFFAQFGNGAGLKSQISLITLGFEDAVNAKLELFDDDGAPLTVVLNGEVVMGETPVFGIPAGGAAVFVSDGEGGVVPGSLIVSSDGPLSGVVVFDGAAINLGVAGVGISEPLESFRAPMETRLDDPENVIRTGVAIMNLDAAEKTLQAQLIDLGGTIVGTGTVSADPLPPNGHVAVFLDEFNWDNPAPNLTHFQGVLEVFPSSGEVAATVLRSSPGNLASLPVSPLAAVVSPTTSSAQHPTSIPGVAGPETEGSVGKMVGMLHAENHELSLSSSGY